MTDESFKRCVLKEISGLFRVQRLKIRETARVFFIVVGNCKNGFVKLVVAKLLKRHRGCYGRKDGDVCRRKKSYSLQKIFTDF